MATGPWQMVDGPAGRLCLYAAGPSGASRRDPMLLLCHELPRGAGGAHDAGRAYPALADRLAGESGLRVVAGMLRGAGGSDGDFSADGWLEDLAFVLDQEATPDTEVWAVGFGLGAALV
ncbi:MAG: hypothetical protein ACRDYZ_13575, partial [Acidimicrobiales bacterium]